jgi:hypothetical protein
VVVALLAGAATYAATRTNTNPAPAATTPSSATTSTAPGAAGGYTIKAGAGGTAKAVDGRTPIGYASTCQGAVEAATNYYTAIAEGLFQDRLTMDGFAALTGQLNAGLDATTVSGLGKEFAGIRADSKAKNRPSFNPSYHPEWGMFRVQSCVTDSTAVVEVAGFFDMNGLSLEAPKVVTVSWSKGDWRLASIEVATNNPAGDAIAPDAPAPLPADQRRAMIAQAGTGWTEYTNAPQK